MDSARPLGIIEEGKPIPPPPRLQRRRAYWEAQAALEQHPRVEHGTLTDGVVGILLTARGAAQRPPTPRSRVGIDDYLSSFVTSHPQAFTGATLDGLRAQRTHRTATRALIKWLDISHISNSAASELVQVPLALLTQWRRGQTPVDYTAKVDEKVREFLYSSLRHEDSLLDFSDFDDITLRWLTRNQELPDKPQRPAAPADGILYAVELEPPVKLSAAPNIAPVPRRTPRSSRVTAGTPRSMLNQRARFGGTAPRGLEAGGDLLSLTLASTKFVPPTEREETATLLQAVDPNGPSLDSVRAAVRGSSSAFAVRPRSSTDLGYDVDAPPPANLYDHRQTHLRGTPRGTPRSGKKARGALGSRTPTPRSARPSSPIARASSPVPALAKPAQSPLRKSPIRKSQETTERAETAALLRAVSPDGPSLNSVRTAVRGDGTSPNAARPRASIDLGYDVENPPPSNIYDLKSNPKEARKTAVAMRKRSGGYVEPLSAPSYVDAVSSAWTAAASAAMQPTSPDATDSPTRKYRQSVFEQEEAGAVIRGSSARPASAQAQDQAASQPPVEVAMGPMGNVAVWTGGTDERRPKLVLAALRERGHQSVLYTSEDYRHREDGYEVVLAAVKAADEAIEAAKHTMDTLAWAAPEATSLTIEPPPDETVVALSLQQEAMPPGRGGDGQSPPPAIVGNLADWLGNTISPGARGAGSSRVASNESAGEVGVWLTTLAEWARSQVKKLHVVNTAEEEEAERQERLARALSSFGSESPVRFRT